MPFLRKPMDLLRRHFCQVRLAQFQSRLLVTNTLPHFNFDRIQKRTSAPTIFLRRQRQFFSGLPINNVKRSRPAGLVAGTSQHNRISGQRQFAWQIRLRLLQPNR